MKNIDFSPTNIFIDAQYKDFLGNRNNEKNNDISMDTDPDMDGIVLDMDIAGVGDSSSVSKIEGEIDKYEVAFPIKSEYLDKILNTMQSIEQFCFYSQFDKAGIPGDLISLFFCLNRYEESLRNVTRSMIRSIFLCGYTSFLFAAKKYGIDFDLCYSIYYNKLYILTELKNYYMFWEDVSFDIAEEVLPRLESEFARDIVGYDLAYLTRCMEGLI